MLFFIATFCFAEIRWGLPYSLDIATYAVNDYSQYSNTDDLSRSLAHKNRFVSKLTEEINDKYPNIGVNHVINRENSSATKWNFINDVNDYSEIVFFAGHGNVGLIALYDNVLYQQEKSFGEFNRWVFFDACKVLGITPSQAYAWFNGVHSILGNVSLGWQFIHSYNCFFSCDHYRSEDMYNYFADYFIDDGETIWDAYKKGVKKSIYTNGGLGIRPAIYYVESTAENGQDVNFSEERFQNVYNGPIFPSMDQVKRKDQIYGSPSY